jgi:hypothetical protein
MSALRNMPQGDRLRGNSALETWPNAASGAVRKNAAIKAGVERLSVTASIQSKGSAAEHCLRGRCLAMSRGTGRRGLIDHVCDVRGGGPRARTSVRAHCRCAISSAGAGSSRAYLNATGKAGGIGATAVPMAATAWQIAQPSSPVVLIGPPPSSDTLEPGRPAASCGLRAPSTWQWPNASAKLIASAISASVAPPFNLVRNQVMSSGCAQSGAEFQTRNPCLRDCHAGISQAPAIQIGGSHGIGAEMP